MNSICNQQFSIEQNLLNSDILITFLSNVFGRESNDEHLLVKLYTDLQNEIVELNESIQENYTKRVEGLNLL